jgi:hypothetical protein
VNIPSLWSVRVYYNHEFSLWNGSSGLTENHIEREGWPVYFRHIILLCLISYMKIEI